MIYIEFRGGLKTQRYATKTSKYEGLDSLSEEEIRQMDNELGYTYHGLYMDEFFEELRKEFLERSKMKAHILNENPNLTNRDLTKDFLLEYKLDFLIQHITEFQKMQGYIELKKYQKEILGRVLNQTERRKIKIRNLCGVAGVPKNMQSVVEVQFEGRHIYYVTKKGTNEYMKMTAEQMLDYIENSDSHFLKERRGLDRPEERE